LQPGYRLTPRLYTGWVQQFESGLHEFLCCRTHTRSVANVEFDTDLGHRAAPLATAVCRSKLSAAWDSGQMPNDLQPPICSLW
jgi:hypothetical protein